MFNEHAQVKHSSTLFFYKKINRPKTQHYMECAFYTTHFYL